MQLYGGRGATLWTISNPSYANRGGSQNRFPRIIVRRPLKKRARQAARKAIRAYLLELSLQT